MSGWGGTGLRLTTLKLSTSYTCLTPISRISQLGILGKIPSTTLCSKASCLAVS